MSGYLFTYSDQDSLFESMRKGRYSTLMKAKWGSAHLPTLGDYMTMRPGDSVYFFSKRMVYGIGEIVSVSPDGPVLENREGVTCKGVLGILGEGESSILQDPEPPKKEEDRRAFRWVVAFRAHPFMFSRGIDMDDLLSTNKTAFRSLRVFEKRSFIELDDEEELAFRAAILRRNLDALRNPASGGVLETEHLVEHDRISDVVNNRDCKPKIRDLIASCRGRNGALDSEAALELALITQLGREEDRQTREVFGDWDYISHQVAASPVKSVQYMDRMDLFGYRWLDANDHIVEKYFIVELKKGKVHGDDLQQVMKYVDWVKSEYASGDYSLISAFVVGHGFDLRSVKEALHTTERFNLTGYRPPVPCRWQDVTFVNYEADANGYVSFLPVSV